MKFLVPTGIGDSVWALHKVESIARAREGASARIDISISCGKRDIVQDRALDFIRRFDFVDSVKMCPGYNLLREPPFTPEGYWNYIDDGMYNFDGQEYCALLPNAALERGTRLEQWLPQYAINWSIFDRFHITETEREFAVDLEKQVGPYCVFYPGPLDGNTTQGHNRDMLWTPQQWAALGERIHRDLNLHIVVVGAPYDSPYYSSLIAPLLNGATSYWTNIIGETTIGQLYSVTSRAKFAISYQAGVGIVSTYLGTPTAIFWRPKGNSILRDAYLSFEESMASAWVSPAALACGTHLPLIYGRHGASHIMKVIKNRGWAR